ncbi:hypothetical protein GE061_015365 [Apolygus lucorum]|uniref:27 kDa hemolymph protein n=1 Tax=Apolygus lucorum TaxID=248454 RepID=A0A8S9XKV3_APOLU|nr:hypothetical protein GE061_015365 [Apolygus lucorum]
MKYLLFAVMFIFIVVADQDVESALQSLQSIQDDLHKLRSNLPNELPSLNEGHDGIREKCLKNGNYEAYEKVLEARNEFPSCVKGRFDYEEMQKEIDEAKPTGDLDKVFRKYCRKSLELKGCVETVLNALEPCLDEEERAHKSNALNIMDSMINFICVKEVDRIALSIAKGGPECLKSNQEPIQSCLNETLSGYVKDKNLTKQVPKLLLDEKQCRDLTKIQTCIVNHLEKCKEPTPANIVGGMFDIVKKNTPCKKFNKTNDAATLSTTLLALAAPLLAYATFKL